MSQTHQVGQELREQLLATARKGRRRVQATVRTVTATAQAIQPQLPTIPRPSLNMPKVPRPSHLREAAPGLIARVPGGEQIKAGVQELVGQLKSAQTRVAGKVPARAGQAKVAGRVSGQVRQVAAAASAATPLARQAVGEFRHAATAATPLARQAVAEFRHAATAAVPLVRQAAAVLAKGSAAATETAEIPSATETEDAAADGARRKSRGKDAPATPAAEATATPDATAAPAARKPRAKSNGK